MRIALDLYSIYKEFFNPPYRVEGVDNFQKGDSITNTNSFGSPISIKNTSGREIWLPVTLWISKEENLQLDCCTIRATSQKTIIETAVSEREGTIKEQYNLGDWVFTVKGVLIGKNGNFPSDDILLLNRMYKSTKPIELRNALAEMLLEKSNRVCLKSLEFPEVEGKTIRHRPFVFTCSSDYIDSLIYTG